MCCFQFVFRIKVELLQKVLFFQRFFPFWFYVRYALTLPVDPLWLLKCTAFTTQNDTKFTTKLVNKNCVHFWSFWGPVWGPFWVPLAGGKLNMGSGKLNMGDGKLNMAGVTCACGNDVPRLVHIGVSQRNVLGHLGACLGSPRATFELSWNLW